MIEKTKSITISQSHFVGKIIDLYSVPSSTAKYPMAEDFLTSSKTASDLPILSLPLQTLFQEKIGNSLYMASHTRPDLLYATTQLSRRSNKANSKDMSAADRLLRYIASTSDLGLTFSTHGHSSSLFTYVDSSYDCYSDSKSHSGVSLHLGQYSGAFLTLLKKQTITADSSTDAEFVATYSHVKRYFGHKNY